MPSISGKFNPTLGVIVQIGACSSGSLARPLPKDKHVNVHLFPALIDTGASGTCISSAVVDSLNLNPISKTEVQAAGGTHSANVFLVDLLVQMGSSSFIMTSQQVTEFTIDLSAPFQQSKSNITMLFDVHFSPFVLPNLPPIGTLVCAAAQLDPSGRARRHVDKGRLANIALGCAEQSSRSGVGHA